jgi:hypothetical protein
MSSSRSTMSWRHLVVEVGDPARRVGPPGERVAAEGEVDRDPQHQQRFAGLLGGEDLQLSACRPEVVDEPVDVGGAGEQFVPVGGDGESVVVPVPVVDDVEVLDGPTGAEMVSGILPDGGLDDDHRRGLAEQ